MIVGASFDTPADNNTFATNEQFGFRLLSDVDRSVGHQYGVERAPDENNPGYPKRVTFLIDPDGVIARVYEVTDAGAHPEALLDDLRPLVSPA